MGPVEDVMNVSTWLLMEILFGIQLVAWKFNLHTSYEVEVCT